MLPVPAPTGRLLIRFYSFISYFVGLISLTEPQNIFLQSSFGVLTSAVFCDIIALEFKRLAAHIGRDMRMESNSRYDKIMKLPHHVSRTRPQMPMSDRAAQFAPFAALTGYEDAVRETGRLTDDRIEPEESSLNVLNAKIQLLRENLAGAPEIAFTYFKADERKAGGAYLTATGTVKRIDDCERLIVLRDGTKLPMDDIVDMDGDIFSILW